MNGMVNLAAKIDKLENRVDSGLQPLQTGIEDLPSKVAAQGAEERLGLEKRLGEASASSGNVNPAMIQAAIAAAMGPVSTAVADLRDRLDQNEAGGSSHQARRLQKTPPQASRRTKPTRRQRMKLRNPEWNQRPPPLRQQPMKVCPLIGGFRAGHQFFRCRRSRQPERPGIIARSHQSGRYSGPPV